MFNKKYTAGITSFAGIAMNNVKAAPGKQKVHIKIGGDVYYFKGDIEANLTQVNDFNKFCDYIKSLTEAVKQGGLTGRTFDFSKFYEDYFVKKVKVSGDETNLLSDDLKIDLSAVNNDVEITLVPKRECIEFEYTSDKQLTKKKEDELLSKIIQGTTLKGVKIEGLKKDKNNKLGNVVLEDTEKIVGGEDINLFDENELILSIDSAKIDNDICKKVVYYLDAELCDKLVEGVDLEKLCDAVDVLKENLKLSDVRTALNKIQVVTGVDSFFKDDAPLTIFQDGDNNKIFNDNSKLNSASSFIVINQITEEHINPIFLKKNFTVGFDNSGNTDKKVDDNILNKIKDALNKELSDKVVIKVSDITSEISRVINKLPNDIIVDKAFKTLDNINIEGVNFANKTNLQTTDVVNAKEIKIGL